MTINKKELITLLREDAGYQRSELNSRTETAIVINGITMYHDRDMRLILHDDYAEIGYKHDDVTHPIAFVSYDDIRTIGYKFRSKEKLAQRLEEIRR